MSRAPTQRVEVAVHSSLADSRVDRVLRKLLPGVPLSRIHRMLREGDVWRGDVKVKGSDRTEAGDVLALRLAPDDAAELRARLAGERLPEAALSGPRRDRPACGAEAPSARRRPDRVATEASLSLPVLYEDEHIIALDKPSGVACHPGSAHPLEGTVLGALLALTADERTATFRPSLVGRLDRDTSGVQLAGRSPSGLRGLEALSRAHEIRKTYLALARGPQVGSVSWCGRRGQTLPDSGRVDLALVDRGSGGARMIVQSGTDAGEAAPAASARLSSPQASGQRRRPACGAEAPSARRRPDRAASSGPRRDRPDRAVEAVTDYRVLRRAGGAGLVEVEPVTGRRHQIRAHFAHLGAHLAGDVRYGDRAWNTELETRAGLGRLFLHCARASFSHPLTGAATVVSSPLPSDLASALTKLGISLPEPYNP